MDFAKYTEMWNQSLITKLNLSFSRYNLDNDAFEVLWIEYATRRVSVNSIRNQGVYLQRFNLYLQYHSVYVQVPDFLVFSTAPTRN